MSKKKLLLILLTILPILKIIAQSASQQLLKVIPPSPNVASLGKFGDIPVGLYTGIPNISIPLYEIKNGNLSLPISLSYHAGGVKVEEVPSAVGLGWSLNAGGIVGRSVRGLPDEIAPWQQPVVDRVENIMSSGNTARINQLVEDVDKGYVDGEADLYYYNFNQNSGKFFYDQAGAVHTVPSKNIIIAPYLAGWKVTTEDGTVYSFTKVEEVSSSNCGNDQSTYTAWYLTSIKSSDGRREITFIYEPSYYTYQTLIGETKYFSYDGTGGLCLQNPAPCLGTQNYRTHRLLKIDFGEGYLMFNYNKVRCDLVDDKSLDEVAIYRKNDELIKKFKFGYSYFGNNSDGVNRLTENRKRLKLVSVTEESPTTPKPPYTFQYNEAIELPDRLSYAQDDWGYYNGKVNNPGLVSKFNTPSSSGSVIFYPGADRSTNPETAQAGILTSIKYPTGGETVFSYESNTISDNKVETDFVEDWMFLGATDYNAADLPDPYESTYALVIPAFGAEVTFNVSGLGSLWQGCDQVECQVIKDNDPTPFTSIGDNFNGVTTRWPAGSYKLRLVADCGYGAKANFSVTVTSRIPISKTIETRPVGGLRILQIEDRPGNGGEPVVKKYKYNKENDLIHSSGELINFPEYGYDLTVEKTIEDDAGLHSNICNYRVRQSFSNYPLATTQGSYVGYAHVIEDFGNNGETHHSFVAYSNFTGSGFPFAPVESFDWRRGFELSTKYFKKGQLTPVKEVINTPFSTNEFRVYGIKTGKNYLVVSNGAFPLEPSPKYSFYPTITEFYTLRKTTEKVYDQNDPTKFIETVNDYSYNLEHLQLAQIKTTSSQSDETTKEEIINNKKYPFDYTFDNTPLGSEALGIKKLQDLHIVNAVIEENVIKQNSNSTNNQLSNQRVVGSKIITYKSDLPYPDQVLKLEINTPISLETFGNGSRLNANTFTINTNTTIANSYKSIVAFNNYDDKGNIIEQQKTNDIKKSYLWGYDKTYPVAEVVGSDYATISTIISQEVLNNPLSTDLQIRNELNKLRTGLAGSKALVTTYTYKPLVGITSQTDANGRTVYYDYDTFGRIKLIRNQDNKIIKTFDYKYQQ